MKKRPFILLLSFGLLLFFLTSPSRAGQVVTKELRTWAKKTIEEEKSIQVPPARNALAVPYFHNRTGQSDLDPLQKGIAIMLTTDLSKIKDFQVLERARLQALLEELGLGVSGLVDPSGAPRVGKLIGAYWLVGGMVLTGKGNQIQVQSNPLEVPTEKILGQPTSEGELSELFRMEKDLLFDIIKLLKIEVTPEEEKELRKPCSVNIKALMALFKGVDTSDHKNYEKAAELYKKALEEDPGICVAREALNELQDLGVGVAKKRSRDMLESLRDRTSVTDQITPVDSLKRVRTPKDISPPEENPCQPDCGERNR